MEQERTAEISVEHIADLARQIRRDVVRMISHAESGHPGGALGIADIIAALYGGAAQLGAVPDCGPDCDRLVLSNGHICAAWYSALARSGSLSPEELTTFRGINSRLQGHPARRHLPDLVEASSGPLGQGLSVANGIALAKRLDGHRGRVFCIVGDGEMQEGILWEAIMTSAHYRLGNLVLIVSYNGLQIDGRTEEIKNILPLREKFESFGWECREVDGHDLQQVFRLLSEAGRVSESRPLAVIARTVMGKGVPFMENRAAWHGSCPTPDQAEEALKAIGLASGYRDFPLPEEEG